MSIKIAVALRPGTDQARHFGLADTFGIYQVGVTGLHFLGHRASSAFCGRKGPGESAIDRVLDVISDCSAVATSAIGPCGRTALEEQGIVAYLVRGGAEEAARSVARELEASFESRGGAA